jgi:DNA gyrase/topoisomerase IV subunit B
MNFNVGIYPMYGFILGVNWSKTDYLDEEETIQQIQVALGIVILEFSWNS